MGKGTTLVVPLSCQEIRLQLPQCNGEPQRLKPSSRSLFGTTEVVPFPEMTPFIVTFQPLCDSFSCVKLEGSGRVAQLVEQCPFKAWVAGSSPAALTTLTS